MKKVFNVVGIILAIVFSLLLIPTLMTTPIWKGVSGLLQPEVIEELTTQIVQELDFSEISLDEPELVAALEEAGITPEAAQAILSSQTAKELLSLLGTDLAQVLQGSFTTTSLTEAEVLRIADANSAELIQIVRLMVPDETAALTDEQLTLIVYSTLQQEVPALLSGIDQAFTELQTELHSELSVALELLTGPIVTTALLIAALVLAVLIFLCRWPRQEGLLWLGIDAALAALPVLGTAISLKGAQISQALSQTTGLPDVFGPVLHRFGNTALIGGAILAAAAVLLIAFFILLRDRRLKKAAAHADYAPTARADYAPDFHADYAPAEPAPIEPPVADSAEREHSPWDNV